MTAVAVKSGPKWGLLGPPLEEAELLEPDWRKENGDEPPDGPTTWSNSINLNIEVIIANNRSILSSRVAGEAEHN